MTKIIAFIPARSGSQRLKNKNIKKINKEPLIYWSVLKAVKSKVFDKIVFSSDSKDYFRILKNSLKRNNIDTRKIVFDLRSLEDSSNKKKIFDYLKYNFVEKLNLMKNDLMVMLLPTAPMRKIETIKKVVKIATKEKKDVFTANSFDLSIKFSLQKTKKFKWKPSFKRSPLLSGNTRSQNHKDYLRPNPVACCLWVKNLNKNKKSIFCNSLVFMTNKLESIDIDTKEDFIITNSLMTLGSKNIID